MTRRRITIVQPYVPSYRVPFFTRLASDLDAMVKADLVVAHGSPATAVSMRGNAAMDELECAVPLHQRSWNLGKSVTYFKRLGSLPRQSDAVVVEQALHNLETYPLLVRAALHQAGLPLGNKAVVGMWGQGRNHNRDVGAPVRAAKNIITRRADWFFAYTNGGADYLEAKGFPRERITVVRNATDTARLRAARDAVTGREIADYASELGLVPDRTVLFLGSLDESKRIPFLLAAVPDIVAQLPGFTLLVAGDGPQRPLVESAAASGDGVVYVGPVHGERRALLGAVARLMLMPRMVGLCAVDSFALRTPLVTTQWPYHGPEFEYLEHGRNAVIAVGGPKQYAEAVVKTLSSPALMDKLVAGCAADAEKYTVEDMSRRFAEGLAMMLERSKAHQ
ncbi:glycosyltransferase involved in cell wall biosynthesis [Streptomyces sp. V4I23]|uniref:glycosyltransferase family 4 protein n=1 Tax=Streptomyces sp. V4I23 TaxID=3042282 RepID=UPI0027863AC0|nr:glycosyltransferase family 4 protein [Streptomyces sp. V4I23]MDQ1006965.1 glycosyltransferase involved in cell wall biosynthesis [Streptomyces sp. V4I23]